MISKYQILLHILLSFLCKCHTVHTGRKLYNVTYYCLFSFLSYVDDTIMLTQPVSYSIISNTITYSPLFPMLMSHSVHTACKLYYDIKYHILWHILLSFLCKCHIVHTGRKL